jgi:hypothetical protein
MADQCGWDEVRAWIAAHRDTLPTTLAELTRLPMAYRRAVFSASPPEVRARFWREHWATFLGPDSPLTPQQQAFVREAETALNELTSDDREATQARARAFEERMRGVFSRAEAAALFATLGPPEPPEGIPAPPP